MSKNKDARKKTCGKCGRDVVEAIHTPKICKIDYISPTWVLKANERGINSMVATEVICIDCWEKDPRKDDKK